MQFVPFHSEQQMWLGAMSIYKINANRNTHNFNTCSSKWQIKLPVNPLQHEQNSVYAWLCSLRVYFFFFSQKEKQRALWEYPLANLKSKQNREHGRLDDSCQCDKRYYQVGFKLLCWRQPGGVQKGFEKTRFGSRGGCLVAVTQTYIVILPSLYVKVSLLNIHKLSLIMVLKRG